MVELGTVTRGKGGGHEAYERSGDGKEGEEEETRRTLCQKKNISLLNYIFAMYWGSRMPHRWQNCTNQVHTTGENNNGASDEDADAGSQV